MYVSALVITSLKQEFQTFSMLPTSSPSMSLILKLTLLHGPEGQWQQIPH